jgi:hypothetical protein
MSGRRKLRGWAIVWALLQLALPGAATYADAVLERDGATAAYAHVESNAGATCQPVHAAECALCHLVQTQVTPSDAPSCIPEFAADRPMPPAWRGAAPHASGRGSLALPRAPPVV